MVYAMKAELAISNKFTTRAPIDTVILVTVALMISRIKLITAKTISAIACSLIAPVIVN